MNKRGRCRLVPTGTQRTQKEAKNTCNNALCVAHHSQQHSTTSQPAQPPRDIKDHGITVRISPLAGALLLSALRPFRHRCRQLLGHRCRQLLVEDTMRTDRRGRLTWLCWSQLHCRNCIILGGTLDLNNHPNTPCMPQHCEQDVHAVQPATPQAWPS